MSSFHTIGLHARERAAMGGAWSWFRLLVRPPVGPPLYYEVTGAIAPDSKAGKRKGEPNWKRRDRATEKTFFITVVEQEAWEKAWETRTGQCSHCVGSGQEFVSWSKGEGTKTRDCRRCKGTGRSTT